jgi:hypothetical protein
MILRPAPRGLAVTDAIVMDPVAAAKMARVIGFSGTLKPLLAGDSRRKTARQRCSIRCTGGSLKSVCRELPRVALAA